MTNNNDIIKYLENKPVQQEVEYIENQEKENKPTDKEIVRQGIRNQGFNPNAKFKNDLEIRCSYSECPGDTDFEIEIYLEGNRRKGARRPNQATGLPGSGEFGFGTNHYLSRGDLGLRDVGQASRVIPLLKDDTVYTVNLGGTHCAEDGKFCDETLQIIRRAIGDHAGGAEVRLRETLNSDISMGSRFAIKVVGSAAMGTVLGPAAFPAGAALGTTGRAVQEFCETDRGKSFGNTVSGIGFDTMKGEVIGNLISDLPGLSNSSRVLIREIFEEGSRGKDCFMASFHIQHRLSGENYNSRCEICN